MIDSFLHIELDNTGIKAMIIEKTNKNISIKDTCHVLFKDLPDSEENHDPFDAGMDIISQKIDLKMCSTASIFVSPLLIYFRNIDLPFSSKNKIKQILPFELKSLLPDIKKEYISDFHIFDSQDGSNLILSASMIESEIGKYFAKLENFNIRPLLITHAGYAAAVKFLQENKNILTFAFLYITDSDITLVLVNNQKPCAVRSFLYCQISPEDIAVFVKQSILGFNQRTGNDISFDIFVCLNKDNHIYDDIEKNLKPQSESISKIDTNDLLLNISPDKNVKYLFNFCKGKYDTSSFLRKYLPNITVTIVLFLCLFIVSMINLNSENSRLNRRIAAIDNKIASIFTTSFPDEKKVIDPYLQMKANVENTVQNTSLDGKKIKVVEVIKELSIKINSSIDINASRFLFNNKQLILSGATDNFNNVDNIKKAIESSDLFKKVSISSAAASKKDNRVKFKFIIEM